MAVFEFRGLVAATGKPTKGVRDADNAKALRSLLKREGILLTEAHEGKARRAGQKKIDLFVFFRRVTLSDVASMTTQLATLVGAGIPLVESMNALSEQTEKIELLHVITDVRDRLNEGTSFAKALEMHPKAFPPLYVNMVAAGEASGTLESVLKKLADFMADQSRLRSKVSSALAYPALMLFMGGSLLTVMMTVVVPKITGIFASLDKELPWYTSVLINISAALSSAFMGGLLCAIVSVTFLRLAFSKRKNLSLSSQDSPKMATNSGSSNHQVQGSTSFILKVASAAFSGMTLLYLVLTESRISYLLGLFLGSLVGVGVAKYIAWVNTPKGALWQDRMRLNLPVFGSLLRLVAVARFSRTLGTLLNSGVPLLKALDIVKNVVGNALLVKVVEEATLAVREGQSLSLPLKRSEQFPNMAIHMITVGEKSGELEAMLENVAKEYERQVETKIATMTSLLEPLIMVFMGTGVGFITFAILMPLIQMNDAF